MKRDPYISLVLGICLGIVFVTAACAPFFTGGVFPHLELYFKLNESLEKGDRSIIHTWSFPGVVKVKKKWIRVSGGISSAGDLPKKVNVVAELSDINTGRLLQRIALNVKIKSDGSFEASKKIPKDIPANSLLTVTAQPDTDAIAKNSEVTLCVDLFKKKGDARAVPACSGGGASFASIEGSILGPNCAVSGCHTGANPPEGLNMSAGQAYANLVNVPSREKPGLMRVEPGDAENSYLVHKIRGDAGIVGGRMPLGQPKLSNADINTIISWINAGAKNN